MSLCAYVSSPLGMYVLLAGPQTEALNLTSKAKYQTLTRKSNPLHSTNSRSRHDYSRTNNFDTITKFYEFSNNIDITKAQPKCKVSLNRRLASSNEHVNVEALDMRSLGYGSSRSSLYSVPSIDWDYRNKYEFRTRSLPRPRKYRGSIYRTNSHSGFVNAFIKNPDPVHYHIPRSKSCGTIESSMFMDFPKTVFNCDSSRTRHHNSLSSIGKSEFCKETCDGSDLGLVKAKLTEIPVFDLEKQLDEFIHSQEFNEDSYINYITGYPIEKETVIDKTSPSNVLSRENLLNIIGPESKLIPQLKELYDQVDSNLYRAECAQATYNDLQPTSDNDIEMKEEQNVDVDLYRAECVYATENGVNNDETFTSDTIVGEYLNFSGEFDIEPTDFVSPVKELIKKDIRNYSVPLNYYCDDYITPKTKEKSPYKVIEQINPLEPIMEESKSSYGDETSSGNLSNESKLINKPEETLLSEVTNDVDLSKESFDDMGEVTELMENIIQRVLLLAELKEIVSKMYQNSCEPLQSKCEKEPDMDTIESAIAVYTIDECSVCSNNEDEVIDALFNDIVNSLSKDLDKEPGLVSADTPDIDVKCIEVSVQDCMVLQYRVSSSVDLTSFNSTVEFENLEAVAEILTLLFDKVQYEITSKDHAAKLMTGRLDLIGNVLEDRENEMDESVTDCSDDNTNSNFSISTLVQYFEEKNKPFGVCSDSDLTDVSDVDKRSDACKIVESVIYYIFEEVFHFIKIKNNKDKKVKEVITVVDSEDILYTATSLWNQSSLVDKIIDEIISESIEEILNTDLTGNTDLTELQESGRAHILSEKLESSLDNELNKCIIVKSIDFLSPPKNFKVVSDEIQCDDERQSSDLEIATDNKQDCLDSLSDEKENAMDTPIQVILEKHEVDPAQCTEGFESISKEMNVLYTRTENCIDSLNRGINYVTKKLDFDEDDDVCSVKSETSLKTFVIDDEATNAVDDMNNAFCDDGVFNISYDESSMTSCDRTYDCSNLYERDDAILGSPFVKRLSVLSMSQIEQTGGIKYWLSFDDCQQCDSKEGRPMRRFVEDKIPSFLSYETAELENDSRNAQYTTPDQEKRYNSDSFSSALTCKNHDLDSSIPEGKPSAFDVSNVQVSSSDMNKGGENRNFFQGYSSSWPPYEDTVFYRILSKFRLSESFDPNHVGRPHSSV